MKMKSASGYGGLEALPFMQPGFYNEIIARVIERDFLQEITNGDIDERIVRCHQEVQIMRAPEVGPWRAYEKNQEMVPNQVTTDAICLSICNAAYNAIKVDSLDVHFMCDRYSAWEEAFLDASYNSYTDMQRDWVLSSMLMEASPSNRGAAAGKFGNIDLGSRGNPVVVDKDNVMLRLTQLRQVLTQQNRWKSGEMFVVLPTEFESVLSMSNLANAAYAGSCKPCSYNIDGLWDTQLAGFNVIETNHAPFVIEDDNLVSYYVIAGHRSAFAYVSDIIKGRIVENPRTFGLEYQMLAVWGGKMITPEAIAVGYWTFKLN